MYFIVYFLVLFLLRCELDTSKLILLFLFKLVFQCEKIEKYRICSLLYSVYFFSCHVEILNRNGLPSTSNI